MPDHEKAGARRESVRLWSLSDRGFLQLLRHGYLMRDSAVGSYLPGEGPQPEPQLPPSMST